jgi:hypothetical protein
MHRKITKVDKTTGSKITFMSNHPELGQLDSLAIYADDINDGKKITFSRTQRMYFIKFKGAVPRFVDTKCFLFSMFKTDNVSHFELKNKI